MGVMVLIAFIMIFGIYAASVIQYIKEEEKKRGRKK